MLQQIKRFLQFYLQEQCYRNHFTRSPCLIYIGDAMSQNLGDRILYTVVAKLLQPLRLIPIPPAFLSHQNNQLLSFFYKVCMGFYGELAGAVIGGGTLLNDKYYLNEFLKYYPPDKPLFTFGTGVNSATNVELPDYSKLLQQAFALSVRSEKGAEVLYNQYGVQAVAIGDPVLSIATPQKRERSEVGKIGVNLGFDKKITGSPTQRRKMLGEFLQQLPSDQWQVEFFAMNRRDLQELQSLIEEFSLSHLPIWQNYFSPSQFLNKIASYDLVIGERLHSVVTAAAFGIPAISLGYQPKCFHFMESIAMAEYTIAPEDASLAKLEKIFTKLWQNYPSVQQHIVEQTLAYQRKHKEFAERIVSHFGRGT